MAEGFLIFYINVVFWERFCINYKNQKLLNIDKGMNNFGLNCPSTQKWGCWRLTVIHHKTYSELKATPTHAQSSWINCKTRIKSQSTGDIESSNFYIVFLFFLFLIQCDGVDLSIHDAFEFLIVLHVSIDLVGWNTSIFLHSIITDRNGFCCTPWHLSISCTKPRSGTKPGYVRYPGQTYPPIGCTEAR